MDGGIKLCNFQTGKNMGKVLRQAKFNIILEIVSFEV